MKRVKIVCAAWASTIRRAFGTTRSIQGVNHSVSSAKSRCISTQMWQQLSVRSPWVSSFSCAIARQPRLRCPETLNSSRFPNVPLQVVEPGLRVASQRQPVRRWLTMPRVLLIIHDSDEHGKLALSKRLVVLWVAIIPMVLGCFGGLLALTWASLAATYSCGNLSSGHCYAAASWQDQAEYFGAYSDVTQVSIGCPRGCGGFIDDEIWLIDNKSSGCTGKTFGMCWVEAGYIATDGANPIFFWADSRPINQSTFNLHLLGNTDPVGVTDHFTIVKDGRVTPNNFLVFIYNDSLSSLYNGVSVVPSGNPMVGNRIDIGQELAGAKDASATRANFTRNIWAVQALGPEYVFWYRRQTTKGGVSSAAPPTGSWTADPSSPTPEGGQFTTSCCG